MIELNTINTGNALELSKSLFDNSVDMILIDPPFGIDFKYNHGYDDNPDTYIPLIQWIVSESNRVLKPGRFAFVFQATKRLRETWQLFPEDSRLFSICKNFVQINKGVVAYASDFVIFWKTEGKSPFVNGRDWFLANTAKTRNRGLNEAEFHSCPRPIDAIIYIIDNFSPEQGLVVDWFMGSGTTALACKMTNRNYWGCEINEKIAEQAKGRVNQFNPLFTSFHGEQKNLWND